ncbi:vWA domain-containing protein [Thorsellia anophelis]|uniref:VWA domain containing CoxE-like protein n=1 Tax=Thorsellia anophelis DSM 18579 TaxID=1123402 RepID=A0A1I0CNW9_9GAMM|nr:VWA domain-containing protein [Thorsellia anophelis]SET20933.1 VWA domain containing CoxE-like protein [Thorsellia anophelis DSM 18579]
MNKITNPGILRWRLLLGEAAKSNLGQLDEGYLKIDAALEWLYGQDPSKTEQGERSADLGDSRLTVPEWINEINELFPKEVIERLEKDAIELYGIDEVVTNLEVLERIEPSETLLKAVLHTKHLMNPDVLAAARKLVQAVVKQIMDRLAKEIRQSFSGTRDRNKPSSIKIARNFDFKRTVKTNLHRFDAKTKKLYIDSPAFMSRVKKHTEKWDLFLLVDQSGSMVSSVIHSAVMAACLWQLPGMKTHLIAFDTQIVDLTSNVNDPVELLMKVQLGGGTHINKAVAYTQSRISNPSRSLIVIISDFYEGGSESDLVRIVQTAVQAGTKVLGLAALDSTAHPNYDKALATRLVAVGAQIGAMTPGQLATWLAEKIQG